MSRSDAYVGGSRSPRGVRLPTVDRSPTRATGYARAGSPLGHRKALRSSRSGNNSPSEHVGGGGGMVGGSVGVGGGGGGYGGYQTGYYRDEDLEEQMLEERGRPMAVGPGHHRSRSATRPTNPMSVRYQSLDRGPTVDHDREFLPIRDRRDRSLDRALYFEDDPYSTRSARQSPTSHQPFIGELQHQNSDLQRDLANLKKELDLTNQKLGSSMHSIKTFWSPELKKERALRKEESAKYSLINDQLKLLSSENQKQAMLVRQLEEELRMRMRGPSIEIQQQMEALYQENDHLQREIAILRDTIKELELRIETQKQTLQARDESIKKLLEMLQNKGMGKEEERAMFQQMQAMAQKQLDEFRVEIQRRDQEILAMGAKMKTLEEQHQDYQRHIAVLKESLCAKEEHYNMLQADVEELRARLDEKNRLIEKKQQQHQQERGRAGAEIAEMREHMDIKDRKINVLQRKLELHEATKKLQMAGPQRPAEDLGPQKKQLEEEKRRLDDQRKQVEEQRKAVESKHRQVEEKERQLAELDKQLQKQKQQMDQLQASLQKAGGTAAAATELNKKLAEAEKKVEQAQEEAKRSATEMERLLQLVQMSQEEQNQKEKQIMEMQQALKNAQAKLKQQQAQSQENERAVVELRNKLKKTEDEMYEFELPLNSTRKDLYEKELRLDEIENFDYTVKNLNELLEIAETTIKQKELHIKELENETETKDLMITKIRNDLKNNNGTLENCKCTVKSSDKIISNIRDTDDRNRVIIVENRDERVKEDYLERLKELEDIIEEKDKRILQLEDGLRETICISTEREQVLQEEEKKRKIILEKVGKLEQRLLSLQSAQAMRCHNCKPYVRRTSFLEEKLAKLIAERKKNIEELTHMKREALEAAISEKDAHLALLEMTGIRNARQAEEVDNLKMDKKRLLDMLKKESESCISLLEEIEAENDVSIALVEAALHQDTEKDDIYS